MIPYEGGVRIRLSVCVFLLLPGAFASCASGEAEITPAPSTEEEGGGLWIELLDHIPASAVAGGDYVIINDYGVLREQLGLAVRNAPEEQEYISYLLSLAQDSAGRPRQFKPSFDLEHWMPFPSEPSRELGFSFLDVDQEIWAIRLSPDNRIWSSGEDSMRRRSTTQSWLTRWAEGF